MPHVHIDSESYEISNDAYVLMDSIDELTRAIRELTEEVHKVGERRIQNESNLLRSKGYRSSTEMH